MPMRIEAKLIRGVAQPVAPLRLRTPPLAVEQKRRDLLEKPGVLLVVLSLLERESLTRRGLTEVSGLSVTGAAYHIQALERVGLLVRDIAQDGVRLRLEDPPTVRRLLDSLHSGWGSQPVIGGMFWGRLQERVQQRRRREYESWHRREPKHNSRDEPKCFRLQ